MNTHYTAQYLSLQLKSIEIGDEIVIDEAKKKDIKKIAFLLQIHLPSVVKEYFNYHDSLLGHTVYGICPMCGVTIEREHQACCSRCGQRLKWDNRKIANSPKLRAKTPPGILTTPWGRNSFSLKKRIRKRGSFFLRLPFFFKLCLQIQVLIVIRHIRKLFRKLAKR